MASPLQFCRVCVEHAGSSFAVDVAHLIDRKGGVLYKENSGGNRTCVFLSPLEQQNVQVQSR